MREALEGPSSDKEIKKQLDELRFFAQRMQSVSLESLETRLCDFVLHSSYDVRNL